MHVQFAQGLVSIPSLYKFSEKMNFYKLCPYWKPHNSARMKTILACLLVLAINVLLSNAASFLRPQLQGTSGGYIADGIDCWSSFVKPVVYDEKCVSIFNKETCTYKVVEKADHSKECPVYQRVG
ncbi:LOW QUALITY PROTEIN: beta-microseminoprotein-like [Cariama cristata]